MADSKLSSSINPASRKHAGSEANLTHYDFDQIIQRRGTDSSKWGKYADDVLPMWVADMDFKSPEPIVRALSARVREATFGYGAESDALREVICARTEEQYGWTIRPDDIIFLPGLVCGLNAVARAIGEPGDGILANTPVYGPFLSAPADQQRRLHCADLAMTLRHAGNQEIIHYEVDFDALEAAIEPNTRLFSLCNPHNPVGRAYTRRELEQLAEICTRHDLVICSDEIHCELLLGSTRHVPIASLSPELAARTITLIAPSKTYNLPGLGCSMAIVPNVDLRRRMSAAAAGIVPHVNVLGYVAALAAYAECEDWLMALRRYLTANRDFVVDYVNKNLPQLHVTRPEATYLAWLDCRNAGIPGNPATFFLEQAKVALNDGKFFGEAGEGFVRLNFGCPRPLLLQGLEQISAALQTVTV